MAEDVNALLVQFSEDDYTPRLCRGIFKVVPFAPSLPHYGSLVEALQIIEPGAKRKALERAEEIIKTEPYQRALWMCNALDTADSGISVFSGVKSAVALYRARQGEGSPLDALETDQQQAADAVLKGLGLAFIVYHLFPGGPTEKIKAFQESETGKALALYYAAVEVGLPFADNALTGGGRMIADLFERMGEDKVQEFASVTGQSEATEAVGVMRQLIQPLDGMVQMASKYLSLMADAAVANLPKAMNVADKVAGVAATGADAMPVWRYLGARLVAERAILQAVSEVGTGETFAPTVHDPSDPVSSPIKYSRTTESAADALPAAPPRKKGCFLKTLFFGSFLLAAGAAGLAATWSVLT
jgi:hypothetical protein